MNRPVARRRLFAFNCVMVCVASSAALSGLSSNFTRAADYHHVHLNAPQPVKAAEWYEKHLGGSAIKGGMFAPVRFGKVTLLFFQAKAGFPGSEGSSVDHIGFSVKDLDAKLNALSKDGVEIVAPAVQKGPIKFAFIRDPWGTKIELVEEPGDEGLHHLHLATTDPEGTLRWYADVFGGEPGKFAGVIPGVRYGNVWLLAKKVEQTPEGTKGRAVDHLGWYFTDLEQTAKDLTAKGIKFESKPLALGPTMFAFITGPDAVRIELVGPAPKKEAK